MSDELNQDANESQKKRSRTTRPYPDWTFEEARKLADAIQEHASGEKVSRLTLFKSLNQSPTAKYSRELVTNSSKYGLTIGSYTAEYLDLTQDGRLITQVESEIAEKQKSIFQLAIKKFKQFEDLYEKYKGKKLPIREVLLDSIKEIDSDLPEPEKLIDIFIVNCKYIGLLQNIGGAETLVSIETYLEEIARDLSDSKPKDQKPVKNEQVLSTTNLNLSSSQEGSPKWKNICFYITPIGEEGSVQRKHSDLFLNYLIEPALKQFGLEVVRADKIGESGMITSQIIEHILYSKLVIADLSFHNPNVFYEMALRHACQLPIIQICRKPDRLPFDVNQVRTIVIDDSDIYTLIPMLELHKSEIATQARGALEGQASGNPISVFFPGLEVKIPKSS